MTATVNGGRSTDLSALQLILDLDRGRRRTREVVMKLRDWHRAEDLFGIDPDDPLGAEQLVRRVVLHSELAERDGPHPTTKLDDDLDRRSGAASQNRG
jgi:hypothetical protein